MTRTHSPKPGPFRVLSADPPWLFGDSLPGETRGASKNYPCMSLAELCTFELPPLADDAYLFLWRVGSMQAEALALAKAWEFRPPTSEIVWVKTTGDGQRVRIGMGRTVRNCHEVALICKRGKPTRLAANVPSVVFAPRGRHSEKPQAFYDAVERLAPGPYAELFAIGERPGWTCYGNGIHRAITAPAPEAGT